MTVREYTKDGKRIDTKTNIKPTREMQELISELWNTMSDANEHNLKVEKCV